MKRKNTMPIVTFFVLILFPTFLSSDVQVFPSNSKYDVSIPFEGLALRWESNTGLYYGDQLQLQRNETFVYLYGEKVSSTVFGREEISPETIEDTVDSVTREVLTGPFNGTVTSHWIETNHSVGDLVSLYLANVTYAIKTANVNVILPSVAPKTWGAEIRCFELENTGNDGNWTYDDLIYYEMRTGIKVFQNTTSISISDPNLKVRSTMILEETQKDTDGDGLTDFEELFVTSANPLEVDSDNDGLNDGEEYEAQTVPLNPDPDMDGLRDGEEVKTYKTNPLLADSDNDGLKDGFEVSKGTNPLKPDTDNDLWNDLIDVIPTSTFIPNALIVLLATIPIVTAIWWWKKKRVRTEEPSTSAIY